MKENKDYNKQLKNFARSLRKNPTIAEVRLWSTVLKAGKLQGYSFNRQRPVGKYIVDFFCKKLNLIIELDGISHLEKTEKDIFRSNELKKLGYHIIRFSDNEVINNIEGVNALLLEWIENNEFKISPPPQSPSKGGSHLSPLR